MFSLPGNYYTVQQHTNSLYQTTGAQQSLGGSEEVQHTLFFASTREPRSSSSRTIAVWPLWAAQWRGVAASGSRPASSLLLHLPSQRPEAGGGGGVGAVFFLTLAPPQLRRKKTDRNLNSSTDVIALVEI